MTPVPGGDPRFFFIHVMKTGGATFRMHLWRNFGKAAVYPSLGKADDPFTATTDIRALLSLPPARRARIRAYAGHFPFVVTELLGIDVVTLTILRDPVERTISYLKHCRRYHEQHRSSSLEAIYDDPFFFPTLIWNHQTKIFAMDTGDKLESYLDVVEIDGARLERAKANLARVDVLGVHERYGEFLHELERRFGWTFGDVPDRRVGEDLPVPDSLRERIAADNAYDVAFYEYARALHDERRRTGAST